MILSTFSKYKKAFIAATIGSSVASAFISFFGVRIYGYILSSIFSLPAYIGKYFIYAVLGIIIALVTSFTITYFIVKPEVDSAEAKTAGSLKLSAVTNGQFVPLQEVKDQTFASKALGDGYAMYSTDGAIFAPVAGTIKSIFPTKHAIGIQTDNGYEILIHMGIDTVELNGAPFNILVAENDHVDSNTQIAQMNIDEIKKANKDDVIMVIVTNIPQSKALKVNVDNTDSLDFSKEIGYLA